MTEPIMQLHSEPYGSTGNIGENFRRLLGAPSLDPLQTVIRESVQNVADAAKLGKGPEILIRIRSLNAEQRSVLRNCVFSNLPEERSSKEQIGAVLNQDHLTVLEICDFGTVGLGGPTRSDRIPVGTKQTDFIDFIRNIGTPRDTEHGGGTYGFGKVSLYRASECSTILVDTLPYDVGPEGRRLIGCHVGHSFQIPENGMLRRFTGRHWWGCLDPQDGVADPMTGIKAESLANALGLPDRRRLGSGTSIMIVGFQPDDDDLHMAANRIVESLLWNFWPRMMKDVPMSRCFRCMVMLENEKIPVPEPESLAPFDLFCKAMRAVRSRQGNDVTNIESQRPAKFLGTLAIEKGLKSPRRHLVATDSVVPDQLYHIALMRPVELVVKYLEGNPLPDERLEWAGVFLASDEDEVERAFADSEPPAHDDWIPNNLPKGREKTFVNVALKRLKTVANDMGLQPALVRQDGNNGPPLSRLAGRLGSVLENVGGDGAGRRRSTGKGGSVRPKRAWASRPVFVRLKADDKGKIAIFSTEVTQDPDHSGVVLEASAAVAVEGKGFPRLSEDVPIPKVIYISFTDEAGKGKSEGSVFELKGREGRFEIAVRVPGDCAVTVDVNILDEAISI